MQTSASQYIAFEGNRRIASGTLHQTALAAKAAFDRGLSASLLVFDSRTSQPVDLDLRGTAADVLERLAPPAATTDAARASAQLPGPETDGGQPTATRGPGRPRLGVIAREVTLLPRHWDWLSRQSGGASVALRKLVESAARANQGKDAARQAGEAAYRFMSALAGNLPGFEEATRALFAGDAKRFASLVSPWPVDVRDHLVDLATPAIAAIAAGTAASASPAAADQTP